MEANALVDTEADEKSEADVKTVPGTLGKVEA